MTKTFIIGIDPGLMTGLCCIDISDMLNPVPEWSKEMNIEQFHEFIEPFIDQNKDCLEIVIEDYLITARTAKLSQQPWSLRLIGVTAYLAWKYDVPLTVQKPSDKKFADDKKLKHLEWTHKGGAGHALDAYRHSLVWIINREPKFAKRLIS